MGQLIEGRWDDSDQRPIDATGAFVRASSTFRDWVSPDSNEFPTAAGRYHLFTAPSCPWAHRTVIFRKLKGLEDVVSISEADAPKSAGWSYTQGYDDMQPGPDGLFRLHQVYTTADPTFTGKVTVPVIWDRARKTIVNNESSEIIRMLNSSFQDVGANEADFYPTENRAEIDEVNALVYDQVNNGVYRAGFAKTQSAYEEAVEKVFAGLDWMEARLGKQRYLAGETITEADWRAFPTLLRFDLVYYSHFKCNLRRVQDYPHLSAYTRELYQWPGIKETCDFEAIKTGYYAAMPAINPSAIVPSGPDMRWLDAPHNR